MYGQIDRQMHFYNPHSASGWEFMKDEFAFRVVRHILSIFDRVL